MYQYESYYKNNLTNLANGSVNDKSSKFSSSSSSSSIIVNISLSYNKFAKNTSQIRFIYYVSISNYSSV